MKKIEQTSLLLLVGTILLAAIMLGIHGIHIYMKEPSLFIPPADNKSRTTLNMVQEAKNLEGLKKICSLWATQEDRAGNAINALIREGDRVRRENLNFIILISLMFSLGAGYIYFSVKKIRKESENAL